MGERTAPDLMARGGRGWVLGFNLQREDLDQLSRGGSGGVTFGLAQKPADGLWCSWQGEQREKQFGGDIKV